MSDLLSIDLWRLGASYLFLIFLLVMSLLLKLGRGKEFLSATVRMTLQLVLVAYILELVFSQRHILITLAILLIMQVFALITIINTMLGAAMMVMLGSVALAVYLIINLGYRTFFNEKAQLIDNQKWV